MHARLCNRIHAHPIHCRPASICCIYYSSNRFRRVEPPQTHEKISYDPCFLWSSVVRGGSVSLNHTKLVKSSTTGLVSLFEPLSSRGNKEHRWLREVEPPQPHVKLHCRPVLLCCTMVQTGLAELNHWNQVVRGGSVSLNHPKVTTLPNQFEP